MLTSGQLSSCGDSWESQWTGSGLDPQRSEWDQNSTNEQAQEFFLLVFGTISWAAQKTYGSRLIASAWYPLTQQTDPGGERRKAKRTQRPRSSLISRLSLIENDSVERHSPITSHPSQIVHIWSQENSLTQVINRESKSPENTLLYTASVSWQFS